MFVGFCHNVTVTYIFVYFGNNVLRKRDFLLLKLIASLAGKLQNKCRVQRFSRVMTCHCSSHASSGLYVFCWAKYLTNEDVDELDAIPRLTINVNEIELI